MVDFNFPEAEYEVEWIVIDPPKEELRARIDTRLESALARGLVDEVRRVREQVGDTRLNELGLEYKIIGEYLTLHNTHLEAEPPSGNKNQLGGSASKLLTTLSAKLWQYARRQKAWLRKLEL